MWLLVIFIFTTPYVNADDVVIFSGVGSIPKSPHEGVKNSLVLIDKLPLSNNNVGLNFNSIWLKYYPEIGVLLYNGALTSNLSSYKENANNKPVPTTTTLTTACVNCKSEL